MSALISFNQTHMKKRILAVIATIFFIIPALTQGGLLQTGENLSPANSIFSMDVSLNGKLKTIMSDLLLSSVKNLQDERLKTLAASFLKGNRFFLSGALPEELLVTVQLSDDEWKWVSDGLEKHTYGSTDVYSAENNGFAARIGGLTAIGSESAVHKAIDLADGKATDSLSSDPDYKDFTDDYFFNHLFSFTLNGEQLWGALKTMIPEDEIKPVEDYLNIFKFIGGSLAETENGYRFNLKLKGNAEQLAKNKMSFNPGGNFTPSLYKKFPNAKPILYQESFNGKAGFEQTKKTIDKLLAQEGKTSDEVFEGLKANLGFDIEELAKTMNRETAFALQYDQNSPIPYATILANVSDNKVTADNVVGDAVAAVKKLRNEDKDFQQVSKITTVGGFTKLEIDPLKAPDYMGPPISPIIITLGVSEDGLLILSNYPNINDAAKRTGFASDPDFSSFSSKINENLTSVFYLNARNVWGALDAFSSWAEKAGGGEHGPPLDFYQGYYSLLEKIYTWRDLLVVSNNTATEQLTTGFITIDQAKHKTYEQLLSEIKSSDRDGDGVSDYDERYLYNTPMDSGDSDNDGVGDFDELMKGGNPNGEGRLFKDVSEDSYYTDEVSFLQQRGAISGYSDKSFQPGRLVNRAEFTTMVVKAFEQDTSSYLGVDVELRAGAKYSNFSDVDSEAWYAMPLAKAYGAGFVSGSEDPVTGLSKFRPGDNITRAEAIAILNKASGALKKTRPTATCANSSFKDVSSDAWYCDAVANAYENGITKGRSEGVFDPNGKLNRAEAAVMIRRTLEKDIAVMSKGTRSFGEMTTPLAAPLMPILSPAIAP